MITRRKLLSSAPVLVAVATPAAIAVSADAIASADHDLVEIKRLIADHAAAEERFEEVFDTGDERESELANQIEDALIAVCAARPVSDVAGVLRRDFLSARLVADTDCNPVLIQRAYDALLAVGPIGRGASS